MKKNVFILVFLFIAINVFAQQHLSFKGIPLQGSMVEFCKKLEGKGFISMGKESNVSLFSGDFTGRNATVGVTATDNGENVFAVVVLFDSSEEWNTLVNTYSYYKDLYIRKYGEPAASKEYNPAYTNSNSLLMAELDQGRVVYNTVWKVDGGDIQLSIEKSSGFHEGLVVIRYRDAQNVESKIQSDLEDI